MFVKLLPEDVRAKISAGEVIESPLDCVKELLENSLDAGASKIEVELIKGGKRYISVKDDGLGIHPEDLTKVILPFCTSKIERFEDLMSLGTYGFRGEALHAIAQVSRMVISSRFFKEEKGYEMKVEGGKVLSVREKGMAVGTKVEVFDLFYNTPVRQKFLKKEDTERARIVRLIKDYAIAKPEVSFRVVAEGKELLNLPPAKEIKERLQDLYSTNFEEQEAEERAVKLKVFVSLSQKRGELKLFINSRLVQNRGLLEYIRRQVGNRRIALFFLEVPPFMLDVNVHPKKAEVRLVQEGKVKEFVGEVFQREKAYFPVLAQKSSDYATEPELVGVMDDAILVVKWMDSLYFIDQHLLAERLNYEMGMSSDRACKKAIKAGDKISLVQAKQLLRKWTKLNNPYTCPHGRPIYYKIPLKEIYQQIGRDW